MDFIVIPLFVFGCIGMTHIIVDSALFAPVRTWLQGWLPEYLYKVFECYQCCGVWVGWFLGALLFGIPCLLAKEPCYYSAFAYTFVAGFASSFLSYGAAALLTYFEANSVIPPGDSGAGQGK